MQSRTGFLLILLRSRKLCLFPVPLQSLNSCHMANYPRIQWLKTINADYFAYKLVRLLDGPMALGQARLILTGVTGVTVASRCVGCLTVVSGG